MNFSLKKSNIYSENQMISFSISNEWREKKIRKEWAIQKSFFIDRYAFLRFNNWTVPNILFENYLKINECKFWQEECWNEVYMMRTSTRHVYFSRFNAWLSFSCSVCLMCDRRCQFKFRIVLYVLQPARYTAGVFFRLLVSDEWNEKWLNLFVFCSKYEFLVQD